MRFFVKLCAGLALALAPMMPAMASTFGLYVQGNIDFTDDTGLFGAPGTYSDAPFALYVKWNANKFGSHVTDPNFEVYSNAQTSPYTAEGYININGVSEVFNGNRGAYAFIGSQPGNPYFIDAATLGTISVGGNSYIIDLASRLRSDLLAPGESYGNALAGGTPISSFSTRGDSGVPSTASIYGQNGGFNLWGVNGTTGSASGNFRITALSTGVVPEPATWMMMIAGFGLIGWATRREFGARRPLAAA